MFTYIHGFDRLLIRGRFYRFDVLLDLTVESNKESFFMHVLTLVNVEFSQKNDKIDYKCFIGFCHISITVKETKHHIPPEQFEVLFNIVSNKITDIFPEAHNNGAVPK